MYILAHDLGTSGNKATLFDESGLLIASRTAAYPTDYASGNRAEQNPHDWWKAIVDTTQALLELVSPADIAGVALSGQMMGCLCVDKNGRPLRPHMLYCDQRSQEEEMILSEKIDPLHFYEITGHRISASYSIEKLIWVKKHEPEVFAQTAKMLNAKDYINYRLCGTLATDPSDASGTNAYDLNRWQWSEEIIEAAGLDLSLFPDVRSSIDVIGEVTNEAARETGLLAGTPVICGGGDGSCAGVGVGAAGGDPARTSASSVGAGAACVDAGGSGADGSGVDDAASAFGLVRSTYPVGWSSLIVISASVLPLTFLGQGIGQHRHDAIGHHAGHVASMAGHVLDDGTGDVLKNRIGRQKQGFDASELAIDQRHAELGFIVAVLAQTLDDNGGADLLAVVGDQAVGGRNGDVLATGFVKGAADHVDSGGFGKHRCFRGVDGHHHMHLVEKPRRALDYIQVSGGNGVIRAGAYCDSHAL